MEFVILLLLVAVLIAAFVSQRLLREYRHPEPEFFEIVAENVRIKGARYAQKGLPPIVLVHGYSGNSRGWREMGYKLHTMGFDVWMPNFRGHGRGSHQSLCFENEKGQYGFQYIVLEDYPAIVNHIISVTGMKVSIVGHSMGGMAAKGYLAGVIKKGEKIQVSEERARELARDKVKNLVVIGSPPHFRHMPKLLRWIAKYLPGLGEVIQAALPAPGGDKAPTDKRKGFRDRVRRQLIQTLDKQIGKNDLLKGIINPKNFDSSKNELSRLLEKGVSKIPTDLARDTNNWTHKGEAITESGFSFSVVRPIFVPILFIAGEEDLIGKPEEIWKEAKEYSEYVDVRTALIQKTSHVDLISGTRAAKLVGTVVGQFCKNPNSLGIPGTHLSI